VPGRYSERRERSSTCSGMSEGTEAWLDWMELQFVLAVLTGQDSRENASSPPRTSWRFMDVRASVLKAGISADRRGGWRSALKSVDYAPAGIIGSSARQTRQTTLVPSAPLWGE